jgi:hypothetical protein
MTIVTKNINAEKIKGNLDVNSISATTITGNTFFSGTTNLSNVINDIASQYSADTSVFLNLSGGTVTGQTFFTNGLSANTISATTYLGLPIDVFVTGATYTNGSILFTNNTGGTFNVTGLFTGNTDVFVTGGTFSNDIFTFTNNTGGTFSITASTTSSTEFTGGTVTGTTTFTNGLSANTMSATTYYGDGSNLTGPKSMKLIKTIKIVSTLPVVQEPNTTYYVSGQTFVEFTDLNGDMDEYYEIKGRPILEVLGGGTGEGDIIIRFNGVSTPGAYQSYLTTFSNGSGGFSHTSTNTGLIIGKGWFNGVGSYFEANMYSSAQGGVILRDLISQSAGIRLTVGRSSVSAGQWKDATTNITSISFFEGSSPSRNLIPGTVFELYAKR